MSEKVDNPKLIGYSIGMLLAEDMKEKGFTDFNPESVMDGFMDAFNPEKKTLISKAQAGQIYKNAYADVQKKMLEENMRQGKEFMARNAKEEDVIVIDEQSQYQVIEAGEGDYASIDDAVLIHYESSLLDGRIYDSSVQRGQPVVYSVSNVMKGWKHHLLDMREGEKRMLWLGPDMAYGYDGVNTMIPPGSTLKFYVHLIEIVD